MRLRRILLKAVTGLLLSAFFVPSFVGQEKPAEEATRLTLPGNDLVVVPDLPGFAIARNEIQKDGRRYFVAANSAGDINYSLFLEKFSPELLAEMRAKFPGLPKMQTSSTPDDKVAAGLLLDVAGESECQENLKRRADAKTVYDKKEIKLYKLENLQVLEYLVPEYQGKQIRQKNLFGCMAKNQVFIDIHVSKILYQPSDDEILKQILRSVRVEIPESPRY